MAQFQLVGLAPEQFSHLFEHSDAKLRAVGARRVVANSNRDFPCRVSLADAAVGEELLLLHFEHHPVDSPYRAAGPVYVRRAAVRAELAPGELPEYVTRRLISVRAYDRKHMMREATVVEGLAAATEIQRCLDFPEVDYLHLHYARPGCFSCAVVRADL